MSHLFQPDRSLLYPQFETYRLNPLDPDEDTSAYALPGSGATQSRVGYNTHILSFKETRARVSWDHLATYGRRGVYVDVDWNVVGFQLDDELVPTFTTLASLPAPISSSQQEQHPEYPTVLALNQTTWAVATGSGSIYILSTSPDSSDTFSGSFIARYDLLDASGQPLPFVLQAAQSASDSTYRLLLSRSIPQTLGKRKTSSQATSFELFEVTIDASHTNGVDDGPGNLEVAWRLAGGDAPFWCSWSGEGWIVLSGEEFRAGEVHVEETEEERQQREAKEKTERLGLGASLPAEVNVSSSTPTAPEEQMDVDSAEPTEDKAWPFSWTQSHDSVSVSIPLPSGTTRKDINIDLTSSSFSLSLATSAEPPLSNFLRTPTRQFWTTVDPDTSTYSFDTSKSTLELELAKVDENTRWPSVFVPPEDDDDEEDEEVPETLSQSMLDAVRNTFSNIKQRSDAEPEGNHPAIPALLREEMDYDLEDGEDFGEGQGGMFSESGPGGKVGREVFVGHIVDGTPSWSKSQSSVVSLPLSGDGIMVKSAVDGMLFEPTSGNLARQSWKHVATSPALSFVLSSKRDTRLVRHMIGGASDDGKSSGAMVMAFDAGGSGPASGNVYVYYPPTSSTVAKQGVVRVSGGERGAMLGVGAVKIGEEEVVVVLCEKSLVVLHGVTL